MADMIPNVNGSSSVLTASDNCSVCQRSGINANATGTGGINANEMFIQNLVEVNNLKKEIDELKKGQRKAEDFYGSTANLNKTVQIVVIVLMIIPVLQLIACAVVVHYLGIQDKIASLLNWVLSGVSLLSLLELGIGGFKLFTIEKKLEEFEKKLDSKNNE